MEKIKTMPWMLETDRKMEKNGWPWSRGEWACENLFGAETFRWM